MRVAIIYDFGVNKGGGDFVMLNIAEALSDMNYDVSLVTSDPYGLYEVAEFFDKNPPNVDIHHVKIPRLLRHPYTIAYMANRIKNESYDVYIVSDDVPRCISNKRGICYIHYPHAARFRFREYVATKYKTTLRGRIAWRTHKTLFPRLYLTDKKPESWLLIANSVVTRRHVAETFHLNVRDVVLLNPPVAARKINEMWRNSSLKKENLIVCIGRFEFEKRFTDVLQALARLKKRVDVRLSLIGFACDERHMLEVIRALRLEENVELLVNANRRILINRLLRAKALVHPSPHEPFGIAVIEGMASGCIPIIRRGVNGPWIEIIQRGRYGFGFSSIKELMIILEKAVKCYENFDNKNIILRSLEFDESLFKQKFIETVSNLYAITNSCD